MVRALRRGLATGKRDPLLSLWFLYLVISSWYPFGPGSAQPGDLLIAALTVGLVIRERAWRFPWRRISSLRYLVAFVAWIAVVNGAWSVVAEVLGLRLRSGFLSWWVATSYYVFNAAVVLAIVLFYRRSRRTFLYFTYWGVLAALLFQVAYAAMTGEDAATGQSRALLLFNNPNQVAYFGMQYATILVALGDALAVSAGATVLGFMAAVYLVGLSLSKAGIGTMVVLAAISFVRSRRVGLLLGVAVAIVLLTQGERVERMKARIETRIEDVGTEVDDNPAGRGYDRIWKNPQYLLLGAGEGGGKARFDSIETGEMHSSIGSILFCYGIVGLVLLLKLVGAIFRGTKWSTWALLIPVFLFGLVHHGMRFTELWIFLGLMICLRFEKQAAPAVARRRAQLGRSWTASTSFRAAKRSTFS